MPAAKRFIIAFLIFAIPASSFSQKAASGQRVLPGASSETTLLPNGWKLTPQGRQIAIGDLPLNMELTHDGKYLLATTNGAGDQELEIIDTSTESLVQSIKIKKSWLGLAIAPNDKKIYLSGGDDNEILIFDFLNGKASESGKINLGSAEYHAMDANGRAQARRLGKGEFSFPAGICLSPDGKTLYTAENLSNKLTVVDLSTNRVVRKVDVGEYPYDCTASPDGRRIYVSNWGSRSVSVIDAKTYSVLGAIKTGDHPNDLELNRAGTLLYVANSNSNSVSVVDTAAMKEIEAISTSLHPKAPAGSTPNAVALSANEKTLYIANADNNDLAVVDVSVRRASKVKGFIPTGWYPTSVRVSKDQKRLFVANGKGVASAANPNGPQPKPGMARGESPNVQYIGSMLKGTVSAISIPSPGELQQLTRKTYANSPYTDQMLSAAREPKAGTAIPIRLGASSPIKHVIYVIRENRTYDQVLGDMKEGNGDPSLTLFGDDITPNAHAIARQFVLFDNFYVDAEVSADGHNWSTAAYATDYVEKTWPTNYSSRGRTYDYEGSKKVSRPTKGFIWDYCNAAGVSFRSYGEFVGVRDVKAGGGSGNEEATAASIKAQRENFTNEDGLRGKIAPKFQPFNLSIPDNDRVDVWLEEFREFEKNGKLPQMQIVRLGNDHTEGTRVGRRSPRAFVAENDEAVGRLVEAVSRSKYWESTAIFILEDDAQNGPDHVDAHRSPVFVISPYTKRKFVDSTMYTTSSVLRTMELILGLPPMSQYDAGAIPLFNAFTSKADLTPYNHISARYNINELNKPGAAGSQQSAKWDFSREDATPEIELNEVIWKSVKGADSVMPAPVRSAFVRSIRKDDDDDDDRKPYRRSGGSK